MIREVPRFAAADFDLGVLANNLPPAIEGTSLGRSLGKGHYFKRYYLHNTRKVDKQSYIVRDLLIWIVQHRGWPVKEMREVWAKLPATNRGYYLRYFGFDPREKVLLDQSGHNFYYETEFLLKNDFALHRGGMTINARVEFMEGVVKNRIIFRRESREAMVDCVHTAIYQAPANEIVGNQSPERIADQAIFHHLLGTGYPLTLPPEEHFVSLRSYVQGIAEMGVANLLRASYASDTINPLTLPFGFNGAMQQQVIRALRSLDNPTTDRILIDLFLHLFESVPEDWLRERVWFLDQTYDFAQTIFKDIETFSEVFDAMPRPWLAQWAFARGPPDTIRQFLVARGFTPEFPQHVQINVQGVGLHLEVGEEEWARGAFDDLRGQNAANNIARRVHAQRMDAVRWIERVIEDQLDDVRRIRRGIEIHPGEEIAIHPGEEAEIRRVVNGGNLNEQEQRLFDEELHRQEQEVERRLAQAREARRDLEEARETYLARMGVAVADTNRWLHLVDHRDALKKFVHFTSRHWRMSQRIHKRSCRHPFNGIKDHVR